MRHGRPTRLVIVMLGCCLILAEAFVSEQKQPVVGEYDAKAGFLTAFTRYIAWPAGTFASPASPLVICVLGSDPFGEALDRTAALTVGGPPLQVRRLRSVNDTGQCHIVFIGKSESRSEEAWLVALKARPILTVGESGHTLDRGGIVEFTAESNQIRFNVNLAAAQQAGLRLSSDMLSHAGKVRQ